MRTGIFFDIDGTLRDMKTSRIPESTGRALRRLRRAGYFIGIATGRSIYEVEDEIRDLVDWDAFVCHNGQMVYTKEDGNILEKTLPDHIVAHCLAQAEKAGRPMAVMTADGRAYLTAPADDGAKEVYALFGLEPPECAAYHGEKLTALMVFGPMDYDYSDYLAVGGITLYPGAGPYADISLADTSKRTGIEAVMARCGLDEYIAFGDSLNDIEMLEGAKIAVAMGNGHPTILGLDAYRTSSVLDDGIERACEALGLYDTGMPRKY